jgi:hypothetical protein
MCAKAFIGLGQQDVKVKNLGYSGCAGCAHHRPKGFFVKEYSHVESNLYFRTV